MKDSQLKKGVNEDPGGLPPSVAKAKPLTAWAALFGKSRNSRLYVFQKRLGHRADFLYWNLRGRPVRSPHLVKQRAIIQAGRDYGIQILVEVGTYYGEMVSATRKHFKTIHTIEYDPELYELARGLFAAYPHIHVAQGDSEKWIPKLLEGIDEPCLFWLDGGYFFWANKETNPNRLQSEISAILSHRVKGHVVLLDDARRLTGEHQSPRLEDFLRWITDTFPDRAAEVRHDIVRITPRTARPAG